MLSAIEAFVEKNNGFLDPLSSSSREAYMEICKSVTHLRSRQAQNFFIELCHLIKKIDQNPLRNTVLQGAVRLSRRNWALIQPFFDSAWTLMEDRELMIGWIRLTLDLVQRDIDVAITFLAQTPSAYQRLGAEQLFKWGQQAVTALAAERKQVWRAAGAYLIESSADQCAYSLDRWQIFLNQASRIATVSATAAEKFIQSGNQVCLMLDDAELEYRSRNMCNGRTADQLLQRDLPEIPGDQGRASCRPGIERLQQYPGINLRSPAGQSGEKSLQYGACRPEGV